MGWRCVMRPGVALLAGLIGVVLLAGPLPLRAQPVAPSGSKPGAASEKTAERNEALRRAAELNEEGFKFFSQGDLRSARRRFEEVLALRRQALPKDHPYLANSLNNLGRVLADLGDL